MSMSFARNSFADSRRAREASRSGRRNRLTRQPRLEGLEARITLTTDVWTGAAAMTVQDNNWSNADNWSNGIPQANQDVVFPVAGPSTFIPTQPIVNDLSSMTLDSIEIDAPGYKLSGDPLTLQASTGLFTTYTSGVSTYSMNTTLQGGNLSVAAGGELDINGAVSGSTGLTLSGGGTLAGTGQVPTLTVTAGQLEPGVGGVGTLTVDGNATLYPGTTFTASINSASSNNALAVFGSTSGSVTLGSSTLALSNTGFSPARGSAFTIIQGSVSGTFEGLPEGASLVSGGTTYRITYDHGVVLTAVEPTTVTTSVQNGGSTAVFGQSVILQATINDTGGTPTGTVTFEDGGTTLGSAPVNSSGVATFPVSNLALGLHPITSIYSGDGSFGGNTSPEFDLTVNQASTTTTVSASSNPSAFGQNIALTAQVAAVAPGSGTPTGSVTFFDNGVQLAQVGLNAGGAAIFMTSSLILGNHPIMAVYEGDTNFKSSTSPIFNQDVNLEATDTTVTSSANPSAVGQSVTFTAQVGGVVSAEGTPSGSVTFFDGVTQLGIETLSGGMASFTTSDLPRGSHSITGVYSGDSNFATSTSTVLNQAVNQANTTTTVVAVPPASVPGQTVTFTATVAPVSPAGGVPAGMVTFLDGSMTLGTFPLTAGTASLSTSSLSIGSHSITAQYSGDGNDFMASTSGPTIELVGGSTVALTVAPNPATYGQSLSLTATVAPAAGATIPSGTVTFLDGTTVLGTASTNSSGVATFTTGSLAGGTHSLSAAFGATSDFLGSTSTAVNEVVNPESTSIDAVVSPSGTSSFGQNVTITVTVSAAVGTPTGSVTLKDGTNVLATTPLNASGVATFSPSMLALGGHSFTVSYSGTNSFGPSGTGAIPLSVSPTATTTTLAVPTSTPGVAQPETFIATVSPAVSGVATPTGTVVFHDGSAVLGTATLANGQAAITVALSGIGSSHVITASYSGNDGYQASASGNQTLTVVQATPTTALFATVVRARRRVRGVTLDVVVQAETRGAPVPTGIVTFEIGRRKLRSAVVSTNGTASVFVNTRKARGKNFVVHYSGDSDYTAEVSNTIHLGPKFFKA